jgi:hypothetical protein
MKTFLIWIEQKLKLVYNRIFENISIPPEALGFYRIFLGFFVLFFHRPSYQWMVNVPPGFYRPKPLTITSFLNGWPPPLYFEMTEVIIIILLVLIIIGVKARVSMIILFSIILINNSLMYSFGKIDHHIIFNLLFLTLAFTNSGTVNAFLPDRKVNFQSITLGVYAMCIVFAFFTAGIQKAYHWIDFDLSTSGVLRWFYDSYFDSGNKRYLAPYFFDTPIWLIEIMDYGAALFEITGLFFLLYSKRAWYIFLILASFFHLSNTLILGIPFIGHVVVYGLWLLSPILHNLKNFIGLLIVYALILVLPETHHPLILWSITLIFSIVGITYYWRKNI